MSLCELMFCDWERAAVDEDAVDAAPPLEKNDGRGLHWFTSQLNLSCS
jgi:hypothetical protein